MTSIIIQCGFQNIKTDIFREKAMSKGRKLVESNHVTAVQEIITDNSSRQIKGKVLPQTRVTNPLYEVTIQLSEDREISRVSCTCKAGQCKYGCKHSAAVCIYINNERTESKTSQPQSWNRPCQLQVEKYKKGCRIEELVPPKICLCDNNSKMEFNDLQHVSNEMLNINCLFSKYIKAEKETESERHILITEKEEQLKKLYAVIDKIYSLQSESEVHTAYESELLENDLKMIIRKFHCPDNLLQVYKNIELTKNQCIKICIESLSQSECYQWFSERAKRIACSKKAHQIKTRKDNFERLAEQFKNYKFDGKMTEAMQYGINMEQEAREIFCAETGLRVENIGLVINVKQPFLAASPDGVILEEHALLEIKCPFSCRQSDIVDRELKESEVPYLYFDVDGNILLEESDRYYTQLQVSMYVLNLKKCHFFVYSRKGNVHLEILRNEVFLSEYIPKIETFYFKYFLPRLS